MQTVLNRNALLHQISLSSDDLFAGTVLIITTTLCLSSWLFPDTGMKLMEAGLPLLALWIVLRKYTDFFAPTVSFPAIYLFWYWLGSIPLAPGNDTSTLLTPIPPGQWLLYMIGFAGLWCGLHVIQGRVRNTNRLQGLSVEWMDNTFFLFTLVATAVFLMAWIIIVSKEGITILQDDVESLRVNVSQDNHITFQILMLTKLIFPLIYLYLWTSRKPKLRIPFYALSVAIILILMSTGNRGMALDPILTVFVMRQYLRRPTKTWKLFVWAIPLVLALSVTGYYRAIQHSGPAHARALAEMGFPVEVQPFTDIYLYVRAPLDALRNVVKQIPANAPFQHGSLTSAALLQILPGRHPSVDFFFKDLIGGNFDGLGEPASILGPFYGDFGLIGVFLGMFLAGLLSKILYLRMFHGSVICILLYSYLWQSLLGSLYGSLFPFIIHILMPIAWFAIIWLMTGKVTCSKPVTVAA